jgi:hypothetical protein
MKYPKTWIFDGTLWHPITKTKSKTSVLQIENTAAILAQKVLTWGHDLDDVIKSMFEEEIEKATKEKQIDLQNNKDLDILPFSITLLPAMN